MGLLKRLFAGPDEAGKLINAGISGIDTVGGPAFSAGFQQAQLWNAAILVVSGLLGLVVLQKGVQRTP